MAYYLLGQGRGDLRGCQTLSFFPFYFLLSMCPPGGHFSGRANPDLLPGFFLSLVVA